MTTAALPTDQDVRRSRLSWLRSSLGRGSGLLCPLLLGLGLACSRGEPESGGETHFLRSCDPVIAPCESGFDCVCGVCTLACESTAACSAVPDAVCVAPSSSPSTAPSTDATCGVAASSGVCEVYCQEDRDCAPLSSKHRCTGGVCRVESSELPLEPPSTCDGAPVPGNEVVLLGDSFLAATHQMTAYLEGFARAAGSLEPGHRYRDYSRLTHNALAWMGEGIRDQYEGARADSPARVILFNGGGADVLLGTCDPVDSSCPVVVDAAAALSSLFDEFASDGVQNVVFVGYPDPLDVDVRARMDALRPLLIDACGDAPLPCHWVELREVFDGRYDEYIGSDGLNPTDAGSEASARAIWAVMERECLVP